MYDFIIIGAGTAGIPAAIFASRRGAKVLLIDAADKIGGTLHLANGQVSGGGTRVQAAKGIVDTPDKHFTEAMTVCRNLADASVVRRTVDEAPATLNWLLDNGLTPLPDQPVTGSSPGRPTYTTPRYIWGANRGLDLLAVVAKELQPEVDGGRVTLKLRTRVRELIVNGAGAVEGARSNSGEEFRGRHTLLMTGGYAMNPALFHKLVGSPAYTGTSWPHALGDGLGLVEAIGGAIRGHGLHRTGSGSILTAYDFPAKVYAKFHTMPQARQPWEVWVNIRGERFVREDEPDTYTRDRGLVAQPNQKYAIVFDDVIFNAAPPGVEGWTRDKMASHFNTHMMFHRAESLDELAAKAGIDATGLRKTVDDFNADGPDRFGRVHKPLPISKPPFYAVIHLGHSSTSAVGVTVDKNLRVLKADGAPIPNLYAAGEVLGSAATFGNAFVPGMMLTPALALGRWLGMTLPIN